MELMTALLKWMKRSPVSFYAALAAATAKRRVLGSGAKIKPQQHGTEYQRGIIKMSRDEAPIDDFDCVLTVDTYRYGIEPTKEKHYEKFRYRIEEIINSLSMENGSDTPDYVLADYLMDCLKAYDKAAQARKKYYGG